MKINGKKIRKILDCKGLANDVYDNINQIIEYAKSDDALKELPKEKENESKSK